SQPLLIGSRWRTANDGCIFLRDVTCEPPSLVTHVTFGWSAQFIGDGRVALLGIGSAAAFPLELMDDPLTERNRRQVATTAGPILPAVSPSGTAAAIVTDDDVVLYDVRREAKEYSRVAAIKRAGTGAFAALAFSPRGDQLAIAEPHQPIQIWDARTGRLIRSFQL